VSLATARRCADSAAFCSGGTSVPELVRPGFFAVASGGVFVAQESCPRGHKCVGGLREACLAGAYQDATGATACKACACGAADKFTGCTDEARAAAPVCAACAITVASRAAKCDSLSVLIGCTNTSHTDSSRCVNCELLLNATNSSQVTGGGNASSVAALNGTGGDVDPQFLADCQSLARSSNATVVNNTTVNGLPAWVIAVIVSVIAVVAVVVTAFVVRKRKQMRERLEELDRKNKSMESDQDLAVTLGQNINPMFRKINPDPKRGEKERVEMAAAEKIHLEEVEEINKHKRALEEELRRLKQEAQVNEASAQGHASAPKMHKRKEFQGGDIVMQ
jgi:heme exporter protein D